MDFNCSVCSVSYISYKDRDKCEESHEKITELLHDTLSSDESDLLSSGFKSPNMSSPRISHSCDNLPSIISSSQIFTSQVEKKESLEGIYVEINVQCDLLVTGFYISKFRKNPNLK